MPKTRAQLNRGIRQEAIREQLAAGGHIQHVIDISNKLQQLKEELDSSEVTRLKAAADIKLKLIDKYLASLQSIEANVGVEHTQRVINAQPMSADEWTTEYSLESPTRATESVN